MGNDSAKPYFVALNPPSIIGYIINIIYVYNSKKHGVCKVNSKYDIKYAHQEFLFLSFEIINRKFKKNKIIIAPILPRPDDGEDFPHSARFVEDDEERVKLAKESC